MNIPITKYHDKHMIDLFITIKPNGISRSKCTIWTSRLIPNLYQSEKYKKYVNIREYLDNRFSDSQKPQETVVRLLFNIDKRPKCQCKNCHGTGIVDFVGIKNDKPVFNKYCCVDCSNYDIGDRIKHTVNEKYNVNNVFQLESVKEKSQHTCTINHGAPFPAQCEDIQIKIAESNKLTNELKFGTFEERINKLRFKRYVRNLLMFTTNYIKNSYVYNNFDKILINCRNSRICQGNFIFKTLSGAFNIQPKELGYMEDIWEEKYWLSNRDKGTQTYFNKTGYYYPVQNPKIKKIVFSKETILKRAKTNKNRVPAQKKETELKKQLTSIKHYGVPYPLQNPKVMAKIIESRKKSAKYKCSAEEIRVYNMLLEIYPDTEHWHINDNRYPFECDFYIPSEDVFIEYNGHWTHDMHYYNENNPEDVKRAEQLKNSNSKYKQNAYQIWTKRDTNKYYNYIIPNKLKFITIWSWKEAVEFIPHIKEYIDVKWNN